MSVIRNYLVSLAPTVRTNGGFTIELGLMASSVAKAQTVSAASLPELEREVRRLAKAYGRTCSPYIRLKDRKARKPAGFDVFTNMLEIIDFVPNDAPAAIS